MNFEGKRWGIHIDDLLLLIIYVCILNISLNYVIYFHVWVSLELRSSFKKQKVWRGPGCLMESIEGGYR